ncbi:MAG: hypothetical protein Q4D38_00860 [Planctomycetia bacterium]|nr:hypothetical protein [Planctomycetia bacterium]
MRTFFEIILILMIVALIGCHAHRWRELSRGINPNAPKVTTISEDELSLLRKLASKFDGKPSSKEDSVLSLLTRMNDVVETPIPPTKELPDADMPFLEDLLEGSGEEIYEKIKTQNNFVKQANEHTVLFLPKSSE